MHKRYERHTESFNGIVIVETLTDDEVIEHDAEARRRQERRRRDQATAEWHKHAADWEKNALNEIKELRSAADRKLGLYADVRHSSKDSVITRDMLAELLAGSRHAFQNAAIFGRSAMFIPYEAQRNVANSYRSGLSLGLVGGLFGNLFGPAHAGAVNFNRRIT